MSEIILAINEVFDVKLDPEDDSNDVYDGFEVETNEQVICVLVEGMGSCCEHWGQLSTVDDIKDFIGAKLLKIERVDMALNKALFDKQLPHGLDAGEAMFVNFETDRGVFQLTVYNSHNGYYGHEALIISKELNFKATL